MKQDDKGGVYARQNQDRDLILKFGVDYIVGIDEAGRGPLAGPVVASAVAVSLRNLELVYELPHPFFWVRDSKKISPNRRAAIYDMLPQQLVVGKSLVSHTMIDQVNILEATKLAWQEALDLCLSKLPFDSRVVVLVDGNIAWQSEEFPVIPVVKGDDLHFCIALASIYAKVLRDQWMSNQSEVYPEYQFDKHKGYGTKLHQECIRKYGLSPIHRRSFCRKMIEN